MQPTPFGFGVGLSYPAIGDLSQLQPVNMSGLLAEFRFDEGSGTTLTDHSSNAYNGTLGITGSFVPTWTAAGLLFSGAQLVQMNTNIWNQFQTLMLFANVAPTTNTRQGVYWGDVGPHFDIDTPDGIPRWSGGVGTDYLVPSWPQRGPNGMTWVIGSGAKFYWNGVETPAYLASGSTVQTAAGSASRLGQLTSTSFWWNATAYYMAAWNRQLSPAEIAGVHRYVAGVLKVRGVTLGDTLGDKPLIVCDGDSLTAGNGTVTAGDSYLAQTAAALSGTYRWVNAGKAAQTVALIVANSPASLDPLWSRVASTPKVYVLWAGRNDMAGAASAATAWANYAARVAAARAAGATKIITVEPVSGTDLNEAKRQAFITSQRAAALGDAHMQLDSDANVGGATAYQNGTYFNVDGIHMVAAGYARVATGPNGLKAALSSLGVT